MSERRRGRRPAPEAARLDAVVRVRFTAAEAEALFSLARREGRELSPMLRERALTLLNSCPTEIERPTLAPTLALP